MILNYREIIDLCGYINHEFNKYWYGRFFYDIEGIFGAFYRFIFTCFASALKIWGICIVDLNITYWFLKLNIESQIFVN